MSVRTTKVCRKHRLILKMEEWESNLTDPSTSMRRSYFHQYSCAKWAASEAIKAVQTSSDPPWLVMESLIQKMDKYSTQGSVHGHIFAIAYDTLMCMYDEIFLSGA